MIMSLIYFLIVGLAAGYLTSRLLGTDSTDIGKNLISAVISALGYKSHSNTCDRL